MIYFAYISLLGAVSSKTDKKIFIKTIFITVIKIKKV